MKKKAFLSLFAILALLCSQLLLTGASEMPVVTEPTGSPAVTAPAEEEPAPAQSEAPLFTYILQDGGVILTGYNGSDVLLLIPEQVDGLPVVGIASLGNAPTVRELRIPDGVRFLGAGAFDGCTALEVVHLGSGVSYIDPALFLSCPNLIGIFVDEDNDTYRDIDGVVYNEEGDTLVAYPIGRKTAYDLPEGVSNIEALDQPAYQNVVLNAANEEYTTVDGVTYTADMTTVVSCDPSKAGAYVMPDTVTTIQPNAFLKCVNLTSVSISPKVTEIAYAAFADCSALQSVDIPDSVVTIGESSFGGCTALEQVEIPGSVETLEGSAFQRSGLTSVVIPDSVKTIGEYGFESTPLRSAVIGNGMEEIGWGAFQYCGELTTVDLGTSVQYIGDSAFSDCTKLQAIVIPDSTTHLGNNIFSGCTKLQAIVIPDSVTYLGYSAFSGCTSLASVHLGTGLTRVEGSTFYGCEALTSIEIPDTITSIGGSAFANCGLTGIEIPGSVTEIGGGAFSYCPLETLTIENGVQTIGDSAFAYTALKTLSLPDSVTLIGDNAFLGCENLASVDLPDTDVSLGAHALDGTSWFNSQPEGVVYTDRVLYRQKGDILTDTTVTVNDGTLAIADHAFKDGGPSASGAAGADYNLAGLTGVQLPEGLLRIGDNAFAGCQNLRTINLPDSIHTIEEKTFDGCSSLTEIELPASVTEVAYRTFAGCTSLSHVELPEGLTSIDEYAFLNCSSLVAVDLPDTVKSLGAGAFGGCTALTGIEIPASVNSIYYGGENEDGYNYDTFRDCTSLMGIHVAEDNPVFASVNGVLYNKEKTKVLFTPAANGQLAAEGLEVTAPAKQTYAVNEELDTDGLEVFVRFNDGCREEVQDYELSPFDSSTPGDKTITVTSGEMSTSFTVKVENPSKFVIDSVSGWNGDTVTLTVRAENNPGVASVRHTLTFDPAVFQYVSCEQAEGLPGFREVNEEQAAAGQITIVWVNAADYQGEIFYTLTLKIADTAEAGNYTVGMTFGERDNMNAALQPVAFTPASGTVEVKNYTAGDLTGDGEPSMDDALLLAQVLSGQSIVLTDEQEKAADLNRDGLLDLADVILLAQMLAAQE